MGLYRLDACDDAIEQCQGCWHVDVCPFEVLLDPEVNANALNWTQNSDKARTPANDSVGKGSGLVRGVDAGELKPNTWQRFERLSSAWNQAKLVLGDEPDVPLRMSRRLSRTLGDDPMSAVLARLKLWS